jgi:hypothetical protein
MHGLGDIFHGADGEVVLLRGREVMARPQELFDICDDGRDLIARLRGDQDDSDGSEKLRDQDFSFSR